MNGCSRTLLSRLASVLHSIFATFNRLFEESEAHVVILGLGLLLLLLLLAVLGGKDSPANGDLEKILSSVGVEVDAERLTKVIKELAGKSIDDLIKEGREKLSSMPVGGGGAVAAVYAVIFMVFVPFFHP